MSAPRALRVGLTGGIGSGLTTAGGAALAPVAAAFGAAVIDTDGALDRDAMRTLVFADAGARRRLEAILHPMIGTEAQARAQAATRAGAELIVFDVPLLTESRHWRERVDRVLVVDCPEAVQERRVAARPGWSVEAARRVISQQASRAARRAIADALLFNDGIDLETLAAQVRALRALWRRAPS